LGSIGGKNFSGGFSQQIEYLLWDSLKLGVDVFTGKLISIEVQNKYTGKVDDKIGIGSTIRELYAWNSDLHFLENMIIVGDWELMVFTEFVDDITEVEEILDCKITHLIVEIHQWYNSKGEE
jgi:hypothetical protein